MTTWLACQPPQQEPSVQHPTQVLAAASHDLRQPLHALSLYLGELSALELPERARRALNDATQCAQDMAEMLSSALDMSRLHAQQDVPSMGVFCIGTVLSRVARTFAPLAHSRGVRLKVRASRHLVCSDPVMVERIAMNFVSNAVRHAPGGRVLVACRARGHTLRLCVHDNGRGIPQAQQQAIFNEFYRVDATSHPDRSGGFGLGLAIVRRLAQALQAPVVVRSTPGRGSMFAVDLPLLRQNAASAHTVPCATGLAGKLVLIIDDDAQALHAASADLRKAGCAVVCARSGRAAMDAAANLSRVPDAIICLDTPACGPAGRAPIEALREEFNCDIPALLRKPRDQVTLVNALGSLLNAKESS